MTPDAQQSAIEATRHIMTGATISGGVVSWLNQNADAVTALAVMTTCIASIGLGIWNAKSNSDRNKVNRRAIIDSLISDLKKAGKSPEYIADLIAVLRK